MFVTDRHDMTLAVKLTLKPNTINQSINQSYIGKSRLYNCGWNRFPYSLLNDIKPRSGTKNSLSFSELVNRSYLRNKNSWERKKSIR